MKLEFDINSDCGLKITTNNIVRHCYANTLHIDVNNVDTVNVQIEQIQHKRKWYLFILYFLEGLFAVVLCGYSKYSAYAYLHPYLHRCSFVVNSKEQCKISISSTMSKVSYEGDIIHGYITVDIEDNIDIQSSILENEYTFSSAFIKTVFVMISIPILLITLMLIMLLKSNSSSFWGMFFIIAISVLLSILCGIKIYIERKKLKILRNDMFSN